MDLEVGQVIADRYFINRLVGRGCLGNVYEARDSARGGRVAIRVLNPVYDSVEMAVFNDKETKALGRLGNAHVNEPVRVEFLLSGERCVVAPFLEGEALSRCLVRLGRVPADAVVALLAQLLDGLAAAHRVGVIHRDLTPRSVMIVPHGETPSGEAPSGTAKLIDFGVTRTQVARALAVDVQSLQYLPPEQLERVRDLDPRSNIYSLGVMAYEALSGQLPFEPDLLGENREPKSLISLVPEASPEFVQVIERALARAPDDRFQTFAEMLEALFSFPQGDLGRLLDQPFSAPISRERAIGEPLTDAPRDALAVAADDETAADQKFAFHPPPPLSAVDPLLAAQRALADSVPPTPTQEAPIDDIQSATSAETQAGAAAQPNTAYRSRLSTAPGIHPEASTEIGSASTTPLPSARPEASAEIGSTSTTPLPSARPEASAEIGSASTTPLPSARPAAVTPPEAEPAAPSVGTSSASLPPPNPSEPLRRVGSTARATSSPTRAAKGTRAAALTRSTPPQAAGSAAVRARPKVELASAAVAVETPEVPRTAQGRLPLVLSVVFLGLAALGVVFFLLPGRNSGQVETKNVVTAEVGDKAQGTPQALAPSPGSASPTQAADSGAINGPANPVASEAATPTSTRDKSPVAAAAPSMQTKTPPSRKQTTSNSPAKKSVSVRSKDPYNYR